MRHRVLGILALVWLVVEPAYAHRLTVNWAVRDDRLSLTAESEGEPATGADVEVRSAAGEVLAVGILDDQGSWEWSMTHPADLTVVVDAGLGHRRALTLTAEQLRPQTDATAQPSLDPGPPSESNEAPGPTARGSVDGTLGGGWRVVLGLTFLLAGAAAWMSWRNLIRVNALERRWKEHEGRS